ncbi:hypothetical protein HDU79_006926 [Rhizoclosmatium sp. JEL0117]|nr:hypothetical protein HDU79_006926 [Rhizoclosmatium sp. JEL0117]
MSKHRILPPVSLQMSTATHFANDASLADKMIQTRIRSNLSGPSNAQNHRDSYLPSTNSLHTSAWTKDGTMVGYILARTYATKVKFGHKAYFPIDSHTTQQPSSATEAPAAAAAAAAAADTLTINEIVVLKSSEGQGIASKMLDFIVSQSHLHAVKDVEFSVLSTNLASETMFTRFAERHGSAIGFGNVVGTSWGSYVDWKVSMTGKVVPRGEVGSKLRIDSSVVDTVGSMMGNMGLYRDRRDLIARARSHQDRRIVVQ